MAMHAITAMKLGLTEVAVGSRTEEFSATATIRAKAATHPHATGRDGASASATTTDAAIATAPISSRRRSAIDPDVDTFRFPVEGTGPGTRRRERACGHCSADAEAGPAGEEERRQARQRGERAYAHLGHGNTPFVDQRPDPGLAAPL